MKSTTSVGSHCQGRTLVVITIGTYRKTSVSAFKASTTQNIRVKVDKRNEEQPVKNVSSDPISTANSKEFVEVKTHPQPRELYKIHPTEKGNGEEHVRYTNAKNEKNDPKEIIPSKVSRQKVSGDSISTGSKALIQESVFHLPICITRHHGPGCAMEINVLEKHESLCMYNKDNTEQDTDTANRVGSYSCLGRLVFKTCRSNSFELTDKENSQAMIYLPNDNDWTTNQPSVSPFAASKQVNDASRKSPPRSGIKTAETERQADGITDVSGSNIISKPEGNNDQQVTDATNEEARNEETGDNKSGVTNSSSVSLISKEMPIIAKKEPVVEQAISKKTYVRDLQEQILPAYANACTQTDCSDFSRTDLSKKSSFLGNIFKRSSNSKHKHLIKHNKKEKKRTRTE